MVCFANFADMKRIVTIIVAAAMWGAAHSQTTTFGWGTTNERYAREACPQGLTTKTLKLKAWRGERLNAQAVVWNDGGTEAAVSVSATELKCGKAVIADSLVSAHVVGYVWTDELNKDRRGGCSARPNKSEWDSSLVADIISNDTRVCVPARQAQPIWLKIAIPQDAKPGIYRGTLAMESDKARKQTLAYEVEVSERTLPSPGEWEFYLDLWQNPYAVARYYGTPLWSKEHFDAMRPIMKMLASIGQKSITASIMHKPWNGQTYDPYDSMIGRTRRIDGTWTYDYTVFDRWVEFMMNEVGIGDMISCYTMIPWALSFDYYDQATNRVQFVKAAPGEQAYTDYWLPFLRDFAKHLKAKGWFERTAISMDERAMEQMREAIKVIRMADKDFKITLAGGYHPEIIDDLHFLSIAYGQRFPDNVKARREAEGKISNVYTCCAEAFPNSFTFSAPAESAWTVLHALAGGYDGWLRWAVMSWTAEPLKDSRFWSWAAGDTYSIYPGPCSSIRFERLREGLQDCEKIRVLRKELKGKKMEAIEETLSHFTQEYMNTKKQSASEMVDELHKLLN